MEVSIEAQLLFLQKVCNICPTCKLGICKTNAWGSCAVAPCGPSTYTCDNCGKVRKEEPNDNPDEDMGYGLFDYS